MKPLELRKKFIDFFIEKGHAVIPPASLIPEHDPTVLFTTAGMHPLVPFLLGEKHPQGKRLVDYQTCIRTTDIDEVGDQWHLTFFEMLGNWSLGDYFKKETITWAYEFLIEKKWLGISPEKIYVSIFKGDKDAPRDDESEKIWQKAGIPKDRIFEYGKNENWWGPAGKTGPCGPDTEIFYDTQKPHDTRYGKECHPNCDCGRFAEIWNLVFLEYNLNENGKYEILKQKNVDTGMGLERTVSILNGETDNYQIGALNTALKKIKALASKNDIVAERIIVDHTRAAGFILSEEITPSNLDQGYVLRRLIRRAIRQGRILGIENNFLGEVIDIFISNYKLLYPELNGKREFILNELRKEENKFHITLKRGEKIFQKELETLGLSEIDRSGKMESGKAKFSGKVAFDLYQSYGYPKEMIQDDLKTINPNLIIDEVEFNKEQKRHQELSRKGAEKKFAGGLADHSEETKKLHTATHLLHQALRDVLGHQVYQKGSNITPERLRFDFSHDKKLNPEEIKKVEGIVNNKIKEGLKVTTLEMTVSEAKEKGAIGLFEKKYGEKVKVYQIGNYSKEICGGPHVDNTNKLGHFKIIKEEASALGIRRIKAKLI